VAREEVEERLGEVSGVGVEVIG